MKDGENLRAYELTARGRGAISVLRIEGSEALERVRALAGGKDLVPGRFTVVRLCDPRGELLDEGLALVESPTRLELHLHGSPPVVARVLSELGAVRSLEESASLEERAEEALVRAPSEAAARMLLDQARGALRCELGRLLELSGPPFQEGLGVLVERGRIARALLRPPVVVLAGPANAGKSTLFNVLVGRERVLVDATPGTTRDAVRERIRLGAYVAELVDTAGERELANAALTSEVERAGQELGQRLRSEADLVLWLASSRGEDSQPRQGRPDRWRVLTSRADQLTGAQRALAPISALHAPAEARATVEVLFHEALGLPEEPWSDGAAVPFLEGLVAELRTGPGEREENAAKQRLVSWLQRGRSRPEFSPVDRLAPFA